VEAELRKIEGNGVELWKMLVEVEVEGEFRILGTLFRLKNLGQTTLSRQGLNGSS
jgi:hypothetical protein